MIWITYLETFQGIRCDKSQFPPADSLADDLNDIIFLPGYLGTRRLQSYYFELPSGSSSLFPMLLEQLSIFISTGGKSKTYRLQHAEPDIQEYEVSYDKQVLGNLKHFKISTDKIMFNCTVKDTNSVCLAEIESSGYWIFLRKMNIGEHITSLRRRGDASDIVSYKIVMS